MIFLNTGLISLQKDLFYEKSRGSRGPGAGARDRVFCYTHSNFYSFVAYFYSAITSLLLTFNIF